MSPACPNPTAYPSKAFTDRTESMDTVYFGHQDAREKIYLYRLEREALRLERLRMVLLINVLHSQGVTKIH